MRDLYYEYLCVKTLPRDINANETIKSGAAENDFCKKLQLVFGEYVLRHKMVNSYIHYYPDILISNPEKSIYIDIEIDEPYDFETKSPIHEINNPFEENRDARMIRSGYTIIRFSEEQIIKHSDQCLKFIQDVYSFLLNFENKETIVFNQSSKRWNTLEALDLAKRNYRISYMLS